VSLKKISELVDAPEDELHELNPHLRRAVVPPHMENYEIRVPVGSRALVERAITAMRTNLAPATVDREHSVRRGDTLTKVARRYHVRRKDLASANNLSLKEKLVPGASLIIPSGAKYVAYRSPKTGKTASHTVRSGDSLWSIAEQYDVTVGELFEWNDLENAKIFPGKKLAIPVKGSTPPAGPALATTKQRQPQSVQAGASEGFIDHTVKNGETLWSIAEKYSVSVRQLYRWNGLRRSRINPGDTLKIKSERGSRANQIHKPRSRNA
jgi:membrane-bound lytic murein transglycosylase D